MMNKKITAEEARKITQIAKDEEINDVLDAILRNANEGLNALFKRSFINENITPICIEGFGI